MTPRTHTRPFSFINPAHPPCYIINLFSTVFTNHFLRNSVYLNMDFTNAYSTFTENNRVLNEAINRLRECGSEAILGEMPKIAVIGNQSAGKSSLIEAMSGVQRSFMGVSDDRFESLAMLELAPAVLWKWFLLRRMVRMYAGVVKSR